MSPDKSKYLFEKYPDLYAGRHEPLTQNLMGFGFECGDGWFNILDCLSAVLLAIDPNVRAVQVKEKYGSLRFYTNGHYDEAEGAILLAEGLSARTCEECGAPGSQNREGWVRTRCDKCRGET